MSSLHFWELPKECRFYLNKEFWNKVYLYKKYKFKSWNTVSKQLKINYGALRNYLSQKNNTKKAQFIPKETLCNIASLFNISLQETERCIYLSKSGETGKPVNLNFPINFLTEEWAGLVGALLSEGCMTKEYDLTFWNKDKEVINKFIILTEKIIPKAVYFSKYKDAYYCILPKIISQLLIHGLDFHIGDKVNADPKIPKIYRDLNLSNPKNKEIIRSLISWLFTGDGWISLFKDYLGKTHRHMGIGFSIISKNKAPRLLEDTHTLIKKFGIHPQKLNFSKKTSYFKKNKLQITESWKFFIHGKRNFEIFRDNINFQDTRRKEILQKSIKSFVKPNLRKGEPIVKIVNSVINLSPCNKHNILKDTGLNLKRIEILLKEAKDKGFVKVTSGGEKANFSYGRKPYIYNYTNNGIKFIEENGGKFL
ncbi:MAG: hypothetical protein PHD81_03480 [Candidatus Nanoarchaeia archaeon]|nr:hypothetical protein [Candidatus Nanoarchaeia archaeon]MDD5588146.1 hypothetical protein [Candidatus Nanoarchaeia archaeon]